MVGHTKNPRFQFFERFPKTKNNKKNIYIYMFFIFFSIIFPKAVTRHSNFSVARVCKIPRGGLPLGYLQSLSNTRENRISSDRLGKGVFFVVVCFRFFLEICSKPKILYFVSSARGWIIMFLGDGTGGPTVTKLGKYFCKN